MPADCAARLDSPIVHAPTVAAPEHRGPRPSSIPRSTNRKENRMTRFLVRCASVAISTSVLAVGAGRADARDSNEGRDAESKNMKLVGFNDLQARSAYQPIVHEQGGRSIAYVGHHGGEALNTLNNTVEKNGTSIVDVTDPRQPKYLFHIAGPSGVGEAGGAQMVRACSAKDLPNANLNADPNRSKHYILRATA